MTSRLESFSSVVLVKLIEDQDKICLVLFTFFDLLDGRRFWLNNSNILMSRHSSGMAALFFVKSG